MYVEEYKYTKHHASSYRPHLLRYPNHRYFGLRSKSASNCNLVFHTVLALPINDSLGITTRHMSIYNLVSHVVVVLAHATNHGLHIAKNNA